MSILQPMKSTQGFLKTNMLGFSGTGKTYAASEIAIGLHEFIKSEKPIVFVDTETGFDFQQPKFEQFGIEVLGVKTRTFSDLVEAINEALEVSDIMIVDSVTHFWRELQNSYARAKVETSIRKRFKVAPGSPLPPQAEQEFKASLQKFSFAFQDWKVIKEEWAIFSDMFVNTPLHMIVCGRAGHDWDYFENQDTGKMELKKMGTKMKAETEFGFEPNLVLECERETKSSYYDDKNQKGFVFKMTVLKDRNVSQTSLMGETFVFEKPDKSTDKLPVFDALLPHVEYLNLGGEHIGFDASRSSTDRFPEGTSDTRKWKLQKDSLIEEMESFIVEQVPGQSAADKKFKISMLNRAFGTRSWTAIKEKGIAELKAGFRSIVQIINEQRVENEQEEVDMPAILCEQEEQENENE